MERPSVSVVVATFNGERFLAEQLDSIGRQTLTPFEVIISDDGSNDGTAEVVEQFAARAPCAVHFHRNERTLGYADNFLAAAKRASGNLIAFADQDDVWFPNKLERLVPEFDDPDVVLCVSNVVMTDDHLRRFKNKLPHLGVLRRAAFASPLFIPHGAHSIFRSVTLRLFPPEERPISSRRKGRHGPLQSHDEWMFFAAQALGSVKFVNQDLSLYRRHTSAVGAARGWAAPIATRRQFLRPAKVPDLEQSALACRARSQYLRSCLDRGASGIDAGRVEQLADRYDRLAEVYARRLEFYRLSSRSAQAISLLRAVLSGCYGRQAKAGLGWVALAQDVAEIVQRHATAG